MSYNTIFREDKRDGNEPEIIDELKLYSVFTIRMTRGAGFDILAIDPADKQFYIVEIKNPGDKRFSKQEIKLMSVLRMMGVEYHILRTREDARKMIGVEL